MPTTQQNMLEDVLRKTVGESSSNPFKSIEEAKTKKHAREDTDVEGKESDESPPRSPAVKIAYFSKNK